VDFVWISIQKLVLPEKKLREKDEAIDELAETVKRLGILQPIIVRQKDDKYEVIAGERRVKAAIMAGHSEVPAIVRNFSNSTAELVRLIENVQREDLSDYEIAKALKALLDSGAYKSISELAYFLGKSEKWVDRHLALLKGVPGVPEELARALTERHFRTIKSAPEEVRQKLAEYAERALEEKGELPSIRELESLAEALGRTEEERAGTFFACGICGATFKLIHVSGEKHKIEKAV